jgi:GNAT superfamily N-acetyltransferase
LETIWDVRQAGPDALAAAALLLMRFFAEEGFITPPALIRARLAELLSSADAAVFLAGEGAAVGVATVSTSFGIEFGRSAELDDLYVLPEARGHGVATALIDAVRAWCQARGCTVLLVTVTPEGEQAHDLVRFYQRHEFRDDGRKLLSADITAP